MVRHSSPSIRTGWREKFEKPPKPAFVIEKGRFYSATLDTDRGEGALRKLVKTTAGSFEFSLPLFNRDRESCVIMHQAHQ